MDLTTVTPGELQQLLDLFNAHNWIVGLSLFIGLFLRVFKADTKVPGVIPAKYRVWVGLGLGFLGGVAKLIVSGTPWKTALFGGFVAFASAVVGQNTVIDSIRGGKEFILPFLTKPGVPPGPGKPCSIPPKPLPPPPSSPSLPDGM